MKNPSKYYIVFLLLAIVIASPASSFSEEKEKMMVLIDPGHGGKDNGAVYKNIKEKDVVLKIAKKLGAYINQYLPDVDVVFTRTNDEFIPLYKRVTIANKNKADLFISLHANYCDVPSIKGTETFVLGLHRSRENLDVAKKENSVILLENDYTQQYEGFDPNSSESYIMFELLQDEFQEQSVNFADMVQDQFRQRAERKDRGVKQAGFLVLRQTGMPSVLVETGFLSNPSEARYLQSDKGQAYLASAIFRAFREYKKMIEAKSDFHVDLSKNDVCFKIQIAASQNSMNTSSSNFKGLEKVEKIKDGDVFKYYWGKLNSYEEAKDKHIGIKDRFPDSFITAFRNNQPISVSEAQKLLNQE